MENLKVSIHVGKSLFHWPGGLGHVDLCSCLAFRTFAELLPLQNAVWWMRSAAVQETMDSSTMESRKPILSRSRLLLWVRPWHVWHNLQRSTGYVWGSFHASAGELLTCMPAPLLPLHDDMEAKCGRNRVLYIPQTHRCSANLFPRFFRRCRQFSILGADEADRLDTYPPNVTPEVVGNLVESLLGYFMLRPAQPDSWRNGFKKFLFVAIRLLRYLSPCLGSQEWCRRNVYSLADIERCIRVDERSWAKPRLN